MFFAVLPLSRSPHWNISNNKVRPILAQNPEQKKKNENRRPLMKFTGSIKKIVNVCKRCTLMEKFRVFRQQTVNNNNTRNKT